MKKGGLQIKTHFRFETEAKGKSQMVFFFFILFMNKIVNTLYVITVL